MLELSVSRLSGPLLTLRGLLAGAALIGDGRRSSAVRDPPALLEFMQLPYPVRPSDEIGRDVSRTHAQRSALGAAATRGGAEAH